MTLQAGTPIGKYVVRRKIAEGGMAEIYLASSVGPEGFEKEVAIKRIRAYLATDPGFVEMFISEARLASKLNHANVVQIFDFDKHEDTYYLAMEFVRGHSLWDVRRRSKELMAPMPPTLAAHIGAEVARGLAYAHRLTDRGRLLNLVHRDVTPHNVLLSFEGAVKLTDFGVAKAGNSQTAAGVLKGKFAYMSPEQSRGEPVDARTDVFALGIVLWEMLTGGRLFDGETDVAVLRAVQDRVIPPPGRLNPDVPADLDAVVMKALDRDLKSRFGSAAELERALAEAVFRTARSLEDRDVGAYLRQLFPEEAEERGEGTRGGSQTGSVPPEAQAPLATPVREPTAVMGSGKATPAPLSPDEDFHGATHVVDRPRGTGTLAQAAPPRPAPRATPPPQPVPESIASSELGAVAPADSAKNPRRPPSLLVGLGALLVIATAVGLTLSGQEQPTDPVAAVEPSPPDDRPTEPVVVAVPPAASGSAQGQVEPTRPAGSSSEAVLEMARPQGKASEAAVDPGPPQGAATEPVEEPTRSAAADSEAALAAALAEKASRPSETVQARREGTVTLTVIPYAMVYLDGRKYLNEVSRTRKLKLPAGKHRLMLRHSLGEKTFDFNLEPGGNVSLSHNFMTGK